MARTIMYRDLVLHTQVMTTERLLQKSNSLTMIKSFKMIPLNTWSPLLLYYNIYYNVMYNELSSSLDFEDRISISQ